MKHAHGVALSFAAVALSLAACRRPSGEGTTRVTAAETKGVTAAPAPTPQADRMARCPNMVRGAITVVREVPNGIELSVSANQSESGAVAEIRSRAAMLATASAQTKGQHRANGSGAAQFGRCPVVMRNTKVESREIPGGAAISVQPSQPAELAWLRREVEARSAEQGEPKAFGQGLMQSCPSAAPNAVTQVEDKPYGVDVRVTQDVKSAKDAMRDIQQRTRAMTSHPTVDDRCPVSVSTPSVDLRAIDVPGGSVIAVKAKRTEDVDAVRRQVRDRARAFQPPML
jgi:hypothetical protein